jgi:D-lactate dehydrogenase (cytochrome)
LDIAAQTPAVTHLRGRERRLSQRKIEALNAALAAHFGNRLVTSEAVRAQHGHTLTWLANAPPDAVVFAESTQDVVDAVRLCAALDVPIIPFGAGTSLEGHVNALHGGVSVDMSRMDRLLAVHAEDLDCVVEPGLHRIALNEQLRDTGLFFPIDPGADASIGGMTATRASGTNAVRYGTMKDNVLSLTVVTADGAVVRTGGRAKKSSAGYDLTRLFVGSEGTLGIITEVTLKLHGIPEAMAAGHCPFADVRSACDAVIATIQSGLPVARIELLDALQVRACNNYSKLSLPETPMLFLEFHGTSASVAEQSQNLAAVPLCGRRIPKSAAACGRRATTSIGPRSLCGPVRASSRRMFACRFHGSLIASKRRNGISPKRAWWRLSLGTSATATFTSALLSTWTTRRM